MPITIFSPQMLRNGTRAVPEIPAGGGGGFTNTYSLDFDGVDDYVDCGDSDIFSFGNGSTDSPFSISAWINMDDASAFRIANKYTNTDREYIFSTDTSDRLSFVLYDLSNGSRIQRKYNTALTSYQGQWINVVATYDGNSLSSGILLYLNGTRVDDIDGNLGSYIAMENTTQPFEIGRNKLTSFANGKIDEVAIFDKVLTPTEITSISAAPTDLTSLAPLAWYRMGDNGSYKSPQWLLPNNENKDKVSNYSFQFDGVDDYVDLPSSVDLGINNTICAWVKRSDITNLDSITGESSFSGQQNIYISGNQRVYMRIGSFITFWYNVSGFGILNQVDTWFHLAIVRSGNDATLYLNGSPTFVKSGWGTSITTKFDRIGAYSITGNNPMFGNLDEIVAFDIALTDQQIEDIYNGGTPTTISDAIAHWRMGEEASFSGGVWTVPDSVGSNDGTSANMTIEDRVGSAPSSSNNAVSFNMDEVDRVEDVPS